MKKRFVVFVDLKFKFNYSLFYLATLCLGLLHNLSDQLMELPETSL